MLGIGHRLEKETKKKIMMQKAREYNNRYEQLVGEGKQKQAYDILKQQQYQHRHQIPPNLQPYNITSQVNDLGGAPNLGYDRTTKTLTQTQTLYKPMEDIITKAQGSFKLDEAKVTKDKQDFNRMKKRIYKDHLAEDKQIDLQQPKQTDYTRNFKNDDKLHQTIRSQDKKYNQKMNDLKQYTQSYLKSKGSLRSDKPYKKK